MTVLMTTHYKDEADTYWDRIALIHQVRPGDGNAHNNVKMTAAAPQLSRTRTGAPRA